MRIFDHVVIGFLVVCMLLVASKTLSAGESPASMVLAMAGTAQVVAPDTTQSPRPPTSGPILQQQNQKDSALERSQDRAEEEADLLNILD
jgi:hypothetical protein